jgi:probable rRNA maturation factor
MRAHVIDVEVEIGPEWQASDFGPLEIERAVDAAVRVAGLPGLLDYPSPIEVSIKLSDNDEVHALNRQWRDKDKPTNVLSFPMLDDDDLEMLTSPLPFRGGAGGGVCQSNSASADQSHPSAASGLLSSSAREGLLLLGDIILAHGVCAVEAHEKGIPLAHHATHLVIHGILHLLGYDHIGDDEAEAMEALEVKALANLGLHHPYANDIQP